MAIDFTYTWVGFIDEQSGTDVELGTSVSGFNRVCEFFFFSVENDERTKFMNGNKYRHDGKIKLDKMK